MRKNYEEMFKLLVEKKVFKKGEVINRDNFSKRICKLGLYEEFREKYNNKSGYNVWDFNDRFKSFMISNKNYIKYLGNGKYEIL